MKSGGWLLPVYLLGDAATLVYLLFFDGYVYTAWNWLIAVPANIILATLWPIYWLLLRPLLGH